jgi:hypothetical protein
MHFHGPLRKMNTQYGSTIRYALNLGEDLLLMNGLIGKKLRMEFTGSHRCFCGQLVPEVYRQNFCRECFFTKPEASPTILKPELSKAHLGIEERDLEFERRLQLQPHYVYLAKTDRIKVGVTRSSQMPTRWMDQGAVQATLLIEVPNRFLAGEAEVALKDHFVDKTSWRSMVQGIGCNEDLLEAKKEALKLLPAHLLEYRIEDHALWNLEYPGAAAANSKYVNFKEQGEQWEGTLLGIRGQYLITDAGVFNVRSHEGFIVDLDIY